MAAGCECEVEIGGRVFTDYESRFYDPFQQGDQCHHAALYVLFAI